MSRSFAKFLSGTVTTLTSPLSQRQQRRTIARTIEQLNANSVNVLSTKHGELKLYGLKSGYAASAAERFHTDEPETLAFIENINEGDTLWDIGANIGLYSLYAALKPNVTVFAFEPSGFNFGLLIEHIALNNRSKQIKPFCLALGDKTEVNDLDMNNIEQGHAGHSLDDKHDSALFTQTIPTFTIDDLIQQFNLDIPDYIKLDVDGVEPQILNGASNTLKKVKAILIEIEGKNAEQAETLIEPVLLNAGLMEDISVRQSGSGRNRLYLNR